MFTLVHPVDATGDQLTGSTHRADEQVNRGECGIEHYLLGAASEQQLDVDIQSVAQLSGYSGNLAGWW